MKENIFSADYEKYMHDLKQARTTYLRDPNSDNKKTFESLRDQTWCVERRFTETYLIQYKREREKREVSFEDEFNWLWKSITIEKKFNTQQITNETRAYMHRDNDKKHNNINTNGNRKNT